MADNNTIARPYAQAVFELANESDDLAGWSKSLDVAGALLADGQVVTYLGNPAFSNEQRLEFLTGLFAKAKASKVSGKDKQGTNFLKLLLEYGRIGVLPEIEQRQTEGHSTGQPLGSMLQARLRHLAGRVHSS